MKTNTAPTAAPLVLVVEDEPGIATILSAYLERDGLRSQIASDGLQALQMFRQIAPDLVLLDIHLPTMDGIDVLRAIRDQGQTPVIMVTALADDVDKLVALRMGADDYVVKPFNPAEVVARVQAVLRRTRAVKPATTNVLRVGQFQIDLESHEASIFRDEQQQVLELTLTEFKLLASLMRAPKRVFSRAELLTHCLPEGDTQERTVDSHISKLRKKFEAHGIQGVPASVWGVGYRFGGDA